METPLKKVRLRREISGETLARAVGVTQSYIAKIENGRSHPRKEIADRIAKYFDNDVTRDQILFPEDYAEPGPSQKPRLRKAS